MPLMLQLDVMKAYSHKTEVTGITDATILNLTLWVSVVQPAAKCIRTLKQHTVFTSNSGATAQSRLLNQTHWISHTLSTRAHSQNLKADWIYSTKRMMTQSYGWNLRRLQCSRNKKNNRTVNATATCVLRSLAAFTCTYFIEWPFLPDHNEDKSEQRRQ